MFCYEMEQNEGSSNLIAVRIGSAAMATGSFLLGTAGVHQIIMKFSKHHRKMHQN